MRFNFSLALHRICLFKYCLVDGMLNLASFEPAVSFGVKAHTFAVFRVEAVCEARPSNDARDAKRMVWGCAGEVKGVRIAVRGACGAEISRQCVGCEARGLDNVGELQAVRACRMGLSKSPKSLRYNFPAPVCGTYRFTSSQVDAVLDLSEIESASSFEFITQTFAVFASRWHAKCAQMTRAPRNAWRRGAREVRRACGWPCAKHAV